MKKAIAAALILCSLLFLYSCKGLIKNTRTSLVTVKVGSNNRVSLDIQPATLPNKAKRFLARTFSFPAAQAAVPVNVRDLRLTVSAADMTAIIQTVYVAGLDTVDFLVDVPNGLQRNFLVEGLDSNAVVQYTGSAVADLNGNPVLLTITMFSTGVFVSPTGTDTPPCSQAAPCLTIPYAMSLTTPSQSAFVSAGTYSISSSLTISASRAIVCTGLNHTTVLSSLLTTGTMIIGSQGAVINGCAITYGSSGASILVSDNGTDILMDNCIVKGNGAPNPETGIALSGNSTIRNSTVSNFNYMNSMGNGISISGGNSIISNNTFSVNFTGINITVGAGTPTPTITGNSFAGNYIGINATGGTPTIHNNTIGDSTSKNTYGLEVNGGAPDIQFNSIYCSNTADVYLNSSITSLSLPNNIWDHATPGAETYVSVPPCATSGIDICSYISATVTFTNSTQIAGGCNP